MGSYSKISYWKNRQWGKELLEFIIKKKIKADKSNSSSPPASTSSPADPISMEHSKVSYDFTQVGFDHNRNREHSITKQQPLVLGRGCTFSPSPCTRFMLQIAGSTSTSNSTTADNNNN